MAKKKVFPHEGVFTRLRASKANPEEAGVFAILPIGKGANPFPDDADLPWVSERALRVRNLPSVIYEMYERFGALVGDRRYTPPSFRNPTQSWYVADATNPNLRYGDDDQFYAIRDIAEGEELTVDYKTIG